MNIILNVPHSAPCTDFSAWSDPEAVQREHDKWTDWHTDTIFSDHAGRVTMHRAADSRYVVDMERLPDDPMEAQGQGIIYTASKDGIATREVKLTEIHTLMNRYWDYHMQLARLTAAKDSILIDCHSFPSDYAEAGNAVGESVDVCIGVNDDRSRPSDEIISRVKGIFESAGYKVGVNVPFSNSVVGCPDTPSFMIELNKKIYLNEKTHELLPWAYKVNQVINQVYNYLYAL